MTQQSEHSGHSRRTFIKSASAGAAVVGAAVALPAFTSAADAAPAEATETGAQHQGAFTVWVKDASTGEIAVLAGEHEYVHHDKALAAKLARLAARASKS